VVTEKLSEARALVSNWFIRTLAGNQLSLLILAFSAFFIFYLFFTFYFGSPIIGSDEYVYFIFGKYLNSRPTLLVLDPYLQPLGNVVYFALLHLCFKFGLPDPTVMIRILHALEYSAAVYILYAAFRGTMEPPYLLLGVVGALLLPEACYSLVVMPEIELVLAGAVLGYICIVMIPRQPDLGALLIGLILGVALLIKPHAMTLLGSALVALLLGFYFRIIPRPGKAAVIRVIAIMLVATYAVSLLSWRLGAGSWTFSLRTLLGLNFYGKVLAPQNANATLLWKTTSFFIYAGAHVAVMALIFSPALIGISRSLGKLFALRKTGSAFAGAESRLLMGVIFTAAMLFAHVVATAYFTTSASLISEGEALRLHGRYLGPVMIYLPFFCFAYLRPGQEQVRKWLLPVFALAVVASQLLVFPWFKIFPWDYPVLFGFFTSPNHYQWSFRGTVTLGHWLMGCAVIGLLALWFFKNSARTVMAILLFIFLAAGTLQTLNWMRVHSGNRRELSRFPRALAQVWPSQAIGRGVLVWADRDTMTYILYGLANAPKVLLRKPGDTISQKDVSGADWVLLGKEFHATFTYAQKLAAGPFEFFNLQAGTDLLSTLNDFQKDHP
jgi:hypothetical protein